MAVKKIVTISGNSTCTWNSGDELIQEMQLHIPPGNKVTGEWIQQGKILLFDIQTPTVNTATIEIHFDNSTSLTEYNESSNTNYSYIFTPMGWSWSVEDIIE